MPIEANPDGVLDIENATLRSRNIASLTNFVAGNDVIRGSAAPTLEVYGDPSNDGGVLPTLEIVSNVEAAGSTFTRLTSNAGVFSIQSGTAGTTDSKGDIAFSSVGGDTEHMRIQGSTGNVGIGTDDPVGLLDMFGGSASSDALVYVRNTANANTDKGAGIVFENRNNAGTRYGLGHIIAGRENAAANFSSYLRFSPTSNGTPVEKMRITGAGNVGIGTVSPYSTLDTYSGGITQRHTGNITPWGSTIVSAANAGLVLGQTGYSITGSGAKYWQLAMWSNDNLHISNRGFSTAFITGNVTGGSLNFTGQHRTFIKDVSFTQAIDLEGLIVSADQNKYIKMSGGIEAGSNAITTNESLPIVSISTKVNDKKCFGVISTSEDPESREDAYGRFVSIIPKENGDTRVYINSVGEGALWVTNIGGSLESGDYITTSNVAGYGQKQDGAGLMNYTVAKITMDCDFSPVTQPIQNIKKELQDVNYWFKMRYDTITEAEFSNCTSESRRTVTETVYIDENGEINTEQYNSLEPDVQSTYTELTKTIYQSVERESFKTEKEGYEHEVRQELVNVLDEQDQIQWEDHPTETEPAYKIRYLDANGNITDEANAVHKAAFVGCTYHCG